MPAVHALVLARGSGTRMRAADPDALLTPAQQIAADAGFKALMPIAGRPFLDYVLGSLADAGVRHVGIVVGPDPDPVREQYHARASAGRLTLEFIVQPAPRGTADAVRAAEGWIGEHPFIVANGDNLYPVDVLRALAALDQPGLAVFDRDELVQSSNISAERVRSFAIVEVDAAGFLIRLVEKPSAGEIPGPGEPMLVSMNCWSFDARIFAACRDVAPSPRGELELPLAVMLAAHHGVRFRAIPARGPVLDLSRRADMSEVSRRLGGVAVTL